MKIEKKDLLKDEAVVNRAMVGMAHEKLKANKTDDMMLAIKDSALAAKLGKGKWDRLDWIIPPIIGICSTRYKDEYDIGIVVFNTKICETRVGAHHLSQDLSFDVFMAKGKSTFTYNVEKNDIEYEGVFCYRKVPGLSWRCFKTGKKVLFDL